MQTLPSATPAHRTAGAAVPRDCTVTSPCCPMGPLLSCGGRNGPSHRRRRNGFRQRGNRGAHPERDEGVYGRLQKRLDRFPIGAPPASALYEILKRLYTEEEAEVAARMPIRFTDLAGIARRTKKSAGRLAADPPPDGGQGAGDGLRAPGEVHLHPLPHRDRLLRIRLHAGSKRPAAEGDREAHGGVRPRRTRLRPRRLRGKDAGGTDARPRRRGGSGGPDADPRPRTGDPHREGGEGVGGFPVLLPSRHGARGEGVLEADGGVHHVEFRGGLRGPPRTGTTDLQGGGAGHLRPDAGGGARAHRGQREAPSGVRLPLLRLLLRHALRHQPVQDVRRGRHLALRGVLRCVHMQRVRAVREKVPCVRDTYRWGTERRRRRHWIPRSASGAGSASPRAHEGRSRWRLAPNG